MKRVTLFLFFIVFALSESIGQIKTANALVDSITDLALQHYATRRGVEYAQLLTVVAKKEKVESRIYSGYKLRIGSLINMGEYRELVDLIDSLNTNTDVATANRQFYIYMMKSLADAYSNSMKYKLSIQIAMQMYDESRDYDKIPPIKNADGTYTLSEDLTERIFALQSLANTYNNMTQQKEALEIEDEILEITKDCPEATAIDRIDAANGAVTIAYGYPDKELRLHYVSQLEDIIKQTKELWEASNYETSMDFNIYEILCDMTRMRAYLDANDIKSARMYYNSVKEKAAKRRSEYDIYLFYNASAYYYEQIGENQTAILYADSVLQFGHNEHTKDILLLKLNANHKAMLYSLDYDLAKNLIDYNDSITTARLNSMSEEMNTLRGLDKLVIEKERLEAQRTKIILITTLIVITGILIFIITLLYLRHKKGKEKRRLLAEQKKILEDEVDRQTAELREKNKVIEAKNRDITDSINYAQQIQKSILADIDKFKGNGIEGIYTFFRPYNIVSGDFYWAHKNGDKVLIACADCTGHGVPGAFVSMVGATMLNEICSRPVLPSVGQILEELDSMVLTTLTNNSSLQDGMDITIAMYDPDKSTLTTASARRQYYILTAEGLTEYKGTKRSIGDRDEKSHQRRFEENNINVNSGDTLYMFSDGITDQFGGKTADNTIGKRLKGAGLKALIEGKLSKVAFEDQSAEIERLYDEWRGSCEQIDDVTFIGVRF